jgi:hypothetical protein
LVPRARTHSLAREGAGGEPIRTKGQTLWYSRHSVIPLRARKDVKIIKKLLKLKGVDGYDKASDQEQGKEKKRAG